MALPDVFKTDYDGTWNDLAITFASLASDASLIAGRASTAIDNQTTLYDDALLAGKITTGTSPTDARTIEIWSYAEWLDANTYPDSISGTDADKTMTSGNIKRACLKLLKIIATNNTNDRTYPFGPISLASAYGGVMPTKWGVFGVHNTGVNLNATGSNHQISYQGVHFQVTDS